MPREEQPGATLEGSRSAHLETLDFILELQSQEHLHILTQGTGDWRN